MNRIVRVLLLVPVAAVVVVIAIANRGSVTFSIDPVGDPDPNLTFTLPLYWLLFAALAVGVLIGGVAAWVRQGRWRKAARQDHAEVERLKREREQQISVAASRLAAPDQRRAV